VNSELNTVAPEGDGSHMTLPVLHFSPHRTFAVVDLRGSTHKGTVDVFHVPTGKRATPPRHIAAVSKRATCVQLADWLDDLDPVDDIGQLRIPRDEYHSRFTGWVRAL
jgi:hypothetical protein